MDRVGRTVALPWIRVAVVAAAALLAGCTMCPDPYDYSGPVPNGSAPQNDFRARSNGILPLGAKAMPWPPIVKREAAAGEVTQVAARMPADDRGGQPTLADPADPSTPAEAAAEPQSVLVAAEEADAIEETGAAAVAPATVPPVSEARPLQQASPPPEMTEVRQAHDVEAPQVVMPPLAETPGWRSRQAP